MPTRIAASAVVPNRHLGAAHLIRMFQEAAMRNTTRLKISSPHMMANYGVTWVLRRQIINANRWPTLGEEVEVITAPTRSERGLLTYRDFHLLDQTGKVIITSSTQWLLMDVASRRPKPLPSVITDLESDFPTPAAQLPWPAEKVTGPHEPTSERQFRVGFAQLDFNNHLTNPVFSEFMLEPLGVNFLSNHLPVHLDVAYALEARYGEVLIAATELAGAPLSYHHGLSRDGTQIASMQTKWQPL